MKIKPVAHGIVGLLTFVPGVQTILPQIGTRGTNSADYCYQVWLNHLTMLWENGMRSIPETVAELGPGDSLGVGLAAILSGVNHYYALDKVEFAKPQLNLQIFDRLVELFNSRSTTDERSFPSHILTDELLAVTLSEQRLASIRQILSTGTPQINGLSIKYVAPWLNSQIIPNESVDVIISQAVLEHVLELEETYQTLYAWLKPGGMMSHQIDFSSHNHAQKWNGHWGHSDFLWNIVMGNRPHLINRQPYSVHLEKLAQNNFTVVCDLPVHRSDGITRANLDKKWHGLSDADLTCSEAFIQAVKS
jgi:hypothetical protein